MSSSIEFLTTPTADTAGTTLLLRTMGKNYVFGGMGEGTQRALPQQGIRLVRTQDFFLTGRTEWRNTGGFVGLMLTLADSTSASYEQAMDAVLAAREKGRTATDPPKPQFNMYGPPNLKHTLGTCRRFIFRRGIPISATEFPERTPEKDERGNILPSWQDANIQVWALPVSPAGHQPDSQAEADLEARRQAFDTQLNTFEDHQAPADETADERDARYDRIRSATLKFMFDSSWTFDTLVERPIADVQMPAAMFVRNADTHGYKPYTGPRPGGSEPLPDIKVFTRTPWPGATILALPPTKPAPECISYIVRTHGTRGIFDSTQARALGVTPGPDFGKLARGEPVQNAAGEWIKPEQVLGADRPGQGVAILDVPSLAYLEAIVQREELLSPHVMEGVCAIIWTLGPGLAGHATLTAFMEKFSNVRHVFASTDVAPNRITFDSVAGQTARLSQIDPSRYAVPVHDDVSVPQNTLLAGGRGKAYSPPEDVLVADRGLSFVLMPKFAVKPNSKTPTFDVEFAKRATDPEVLHLAQSAQESLVDNKESMQAWKQLLARPDTEVTTLGTGSAQPSKYRNVSATLVRVPGVGNYLLDCGENTLGQLSRAFPPAELEDIIKNLRMVWISHLHADHHLGTAGLIRTWYHLVHGGVPGKEPLDASTISSKASDYGLSVISHSGMLQWLYEYSSVEDFGYSRILPLEITPFHQQHPSTLNILNSFNVKGSENTLIPPAQYEQLFGFTDIQSAAVLHCHGAMAVSITFPHSPSDPAGVKPLKVSYSGDCRPSRAFARIGKHSTVLIHESTFDDELAGDALAKKHSTTSEALGIGAQMRAKAVVLTHFSQRYQKIPILQTVTDGEQDDNMPDDRQDANDDIADEQIDNADNVDIYTTIPSTSQHHLSSTERVVKTRNPDMKVAIAFDYMRVKIGEICELETFNDALSALLAKESVDDGDGDVVSGDKKVGGVNVNANGKKGLDGDEGGIGGDGGGKNKKRKKGGGEGRRRN